MTNPTPFDAFAREYHILWNNSQRSEVWSEIDPLFHPGDRILDLGCGPGDDALHFAERGVEVLGIDDSWKMIEIAMERGVEIQRLKIQELATLEGEFSGAISNFGALNCVADLPAVAVQLGRLVLSGGPVAICIMGRFAWGEMLAFARKLDWRRAIRRWRGHAMWRGTEVFYYSSRKVRAAFTPEFSLERHISIGRGDHQLYLFRRRSKC